MDYIVKRSKRKTFGLAITSEGLVVRAPLRATQSEIESVLRKNRTWIDRHMAKQMQVKAQAQQKGLLSQAEVRALADRARAYIPQRVAYYAPLLGVQPGRITIRKQKTRWGSCSGKGNLNFNCLLMLTPPEVIDSVVVHELCHRKEMNHSKRFYAEVLRVFPDYYRWNGWLKKNGTAILRQMTG